MDTADKLISVIVPVYNVEKYLNKCVESIVNQTYKNLEIILVDDGSPDNCPQMRDAWVKKDSRIKVIHKENGGVSSARNAGLRIAKGEYISFVDSDDWMDEDMLSYLLENALSYKADIVRCSYYTDTDEGSYPLDWTTTPKFLSRDQRIIDLAENGFLAGSTWNKLYSHSIISVWFQNVFLEDLWFNYELYVNSKLRLLVLSEPKYHYYMRSDSAMHADFSVRAIDHLKVKEDIVLLEKNNSKVYSHWLKSYISAAFIFLSRSCRGKSYLEMFLLLRKKILKYKWQIFSNTIFEWREKLKTLVLWLSPPLYKLLIKAYFSR